ncbi:MAG: O-antigen ligase family protein [bacterium]|nr:O-antigen ligase family protein [bacterium]
MTNKILKFISLGSLFLVPFVPLVVESSFFFPFITGKGYAFRLLVEISSVAWLILAIREPSYRPKWSGIMWSALAFISIIFVADLLSANVFKSFWSNFERMEGWFLILHLFGFFVVSSSLLKTHLSWAKFFHTFLGVGLFVSLYGLVQLYGELVINQGGMRVDATFGNAIYLAVFLLFLIFISFFMLSSSLISRGDKFFSILQSYALGATLFLAYPFYYRDQLIKEGAEGAVPLFTGPAMKFLFLLSLVVLISVIYLYIKREAFGEKLKQWIIISGYGVLISVFVFVLFNTATRGAVLGLVGGILLSTVAIALFEKVRKNLRKSAIVVLTVLILCISGFIVLKDTAFVKNNAVLSRLSSITLKEGSTRFTIWEIALKGAKERPVLGWGQESFNHVFNKYYDPTLYNQEQWFDRAHNTFLDWLIAGGILGLFSYLSLFFFALYYLWDRHKTDVTGFWAKFVSFFSPRREKTFDHTEAAIMTGLFGAYAFQSIFVFDNLLSYIMFFSVLAYLHSVYGEEKSYLDKFWEVARRRFAFSFATVVAIFVLSFWFFVAKGALASGTLVKATRPQQGGVDKNIALLEKAYSFDTTGRQEVVEQTMSLAAQIAGYSDSKGRSDFLDFTEKLLDKEIEGNPNDPRLWMFKGYFHQNLGQAGRALQAFSRAVELSPNKQSLLIQRGVAELILGRTEKSLSSFELAYNLATSSRESQVVYAVGAVYAGKTQLADRLVSQMREEDAKTGTVFVSDIRLAQTYYAVKSFSKAIELLEEALEANPSLIDYREMLADAYAETGRKAEAVAQLQELKKLAPSKAGEYQDKINGLR